MLASPTDLVKVVLTSPFVLVCVEHLFERWVYAIINAPIESTIIRPRNPDMISPEEGNKERTTAILGLRKNPPRFVRDTIVGFLRIIGWADADSSLDSQSVTNASYTQNLHHSDTTDVDGRQISNLNILQPPVTLQHSLVGPGTEPTETVTIPISSVSDVVPSSPPQSPPLSPTASQTSYNDGDPRIRITTRGDLVEMEVRLPPHVLSSHTEIAGSGPSTPVPRDLASPTPIRSPGLLLYHRVTQLSSEPSSMLGSICKAQIVSLVSLPLKLITLRLVASHYLGTRQELAGPRGVIGMFAWPKELDWTSSGALVSRLALCGTLELAIDLAIWSCQYCAVSWLGTRVFDWGTL